MPAFRIIKKVSPVITGLFCIVLSVAFVVDKDDFLAGQKANSRVKLAYTEKQGLLANKLKSLGYDLDNINILITAFKTEQQLNIYIKKPAETKYRKFASYDICSSSGMLGPKRRSGDGQVPEGFYYIERFNPQSTYYLSLALTTPTRPIK
jgi:murein L,D-transpeptidase YafK